MTDLLDRAFPLDQCDYGWNHGEPCATKQAFIEGRLNKGEWSGDQSGCHPNLCDSYV
jgi:hypothetical protein